MIHIGNEVIIIPVPGTREIQSFLKSDEIELLYADNLNEIEDFSAISQQKELLLLSICNNANYQNLEFLGEKPKLRKLILHNTNLRNLHGISGCTALEELSLQNNKYLADLTHVKIMTTLKKIDLSYCDNIQSIMPLFHLPHLTEINLRGCPYLIDHPDKQYYTPEFKQKFRFN
jgi:hypothetical protein